jgi:hypothetical protein
MRKWIIGALAVVPVVLAVAAAALAGPSGKASVSFVKPAQGSKTGSKVTVVVKLKNFTISAANVGKAPRAGQGHVHFAMDGGKYDFPKYSGANGQLAAKLGIAGKYSPSVAPTITYSKLPKGKHTLTVFLVKNDHSNLGPKASVSFTVQ